MNGRKKEREGKMDGSSEKKGENKTKVNANYKRERVLSKKRLKDQFLK